MAAPTFFRTDGWVKAVTGAAVSGAQVYVAQQPANTTFAPPSPLQTIYSDANGLVPIQQPILTDGFGHYDFYVTPGTYTVVVALNGVIQQVYTDQTIGLASGGLGTVTSVGLVDGSGGLLSISGSPITSSGNITVGFSTEPANSVFAGPASGPNAAPTFRALSLTDLPSISFSNITGSLSANQLPIFGTAGTTSFVSWTTWRGFGSGGSNGASWIPSGQPANTISFLQLDLYSATTIRKITTQWVSNSGGGPHFSTCAIYSLDGTTKLVDAGQNAFSDANITTPQTVTLVSPVTLNAGSYLVAWGATTAAGSGAMGFTWAIATELSILNNTYKRYGLAGNALSSGSMPSSLGTLTVRNVADVFAGFMFET